MNIAVENRKGKRIAGISTGAYVLLCCIFLFTLKCEKEDDMGQMGVIVNLGTSDMGMNEDNIPTAPNTEVQEETSSTEQTESAAEAEIESATQDMESTPVVATPKPSNPSPKPTTNTNPKPTESNPTPAKPQVNDNALFNGPSNPNQGTGNQAGDQGNPNGSLESDIYGDISGSGLGSDGKGWGLKGRGLVSKPQPTNPTNQFGNVTIKITVDKYGKVIKAEFTSFNSTTTNSDLVALSISEAYKVKFNNVATDPKSRDKQVGYVVFKYQAN